MFWPILSPTVQLFLCECLMRMSPKKHVMTVIHSNYTGLPQVRQVIYTILHIPGKCVHVLCNSEFSWWSGSRLNTLTITAGAQHSEETHTHREPLHTFIWTQARCCTHADTLFESLRHMGYCCTCLVGWPECWPLIG